MSVHVTRLQAVGNLTNLKRRITDDMAAFARKTSVHRLEKVANADARREDIASIDKAITALMYMEAHDLD